MGARSQVAQLVFAVVVLLVLLFLTGPLQYLPRRVLAGIVFTIAVGMIDVKGLRDIRRESPGEFDLAVITAAAVVAIGVEEGILLAIALSLFRHVRHSYRPHTMMLTPDETGHWTPMPVTPGKETEPGLAVYRSPRRPRAEVAADRRVIVRLPRTFGLAYPCGTHVTTVR